MKLHLKFPATIRLTCLSISNRLEIGSPAPVSKGSSADSIHTTDRKCDIKVQL